MKCSKCGSAENRIPPLTTWCESCLAKIPKPDTGEFHHANIKRDSEHKVKK